MSQYDWRNNNNSHFSRLWGPQRRSDFTGAGFLFSFLFHCFIVIPMVTIWNPGNLSEVKTYSVSIVAGSRLGGPRARLDQQSIVKIADKSKELIETENLVKKKPALESSKPSLVNSPSPVPSVKSTATPIPTILVATEAVAEPTPKPKPTKVPATKVPTVPPTRALPTRPLPTVTIAARPSDTPAFTATVRATVTEVPKRTATPTEIPVNHGDSDNSGVNRDSDKSDEAMPSQTTEALKSKLPRKTKPSKELGHQEYNQLMEKYLGDEAKRESGSQKLSSTGTGGDDQRPAEFFSYGERMKQEIDRRWVWHLRHEGLRTHIKMRIAEDGSIEFAEIVKGSGNLEFDRSVMRAIKAADPLPPPPTSVYQYFEDIDVIFDPND